MSSKDYETFVTTNWKYGEGPFAIEMAAIGLANEAGEALGEIKKLMRHWHLTGHFHDPIDDATKERVNKELGDTLYYLLVTGQLFGLSLQDIIDTNINKLNKRKDKNEQ